MFAVVFEVHPSEGKKEEYLGLAEYLKPMLEETDGFLCNERFESRRRRGWVLSLSFWRDEKSVVRWRSRGEHHAIQLQGRAGVFSDYRLRVGEVTADSGEAALVQQRFDETEIGLAKALGITEIPSQAGRAATADDAATVALVGLDPKGPGLVDHDVFESIYEPGKLLLLAAWKTAADAERWSPRETAGRLHHRRIRSIRDYGLFDRREAAQFCPIAQRR